MTTQRETMLLERLREAAQVLRETRAELDTLEQEQTEPIAIVGMGCRFPGGANTPESFWELLDSGRDAVTSLEPRWSLVGVQPGDDMPRWAGLLTEPVDRFDAAFFGISPREARPLDPQHRLLLEVTWEALEHARVPPMSLDGSRTGVFVGANSSEYLFSTVGPQPREERDAYSTTGNMLSVAAGRLAYTLGLRGACLTVDTACSSSLVAVHLACRSLRSRESDLALAAGVNILLSPDSMDAMARTQALSPDGRCRTFDASANGYVRGEGCGVVVLKRLSDAQRDGDPILALIRGSAINQDGRSTGLTAPNVLAQEALVREALKNARAEASDIGYVETHGTGTSLGDPIEVEALRAVLGPVRADGSHCVLGALKTNIGHLEGAAGVAGVIKAVLSLRNERIPRNLNFRTLNPRIRLEGTALALATENQPWPRTERPRLAGVSSFGISGTNAHVVLEEAPAAPAMAAAPGRSAELLVLSGKSAAALDAQAAKLRAHLDAHPEQGLSDVAFSLATTRSTMEHRLTLVSGSREELLKALDVAAQGQTPARAVRGRAASSVAPKVVFVFPGQGSQWLGMGRKLLAEEPVFREALEACDKAIQAEAGWSLLAELQAEEAASNLGRIDVVQPALFAMSVALTALWRAWGVEPDAVVGHSMGEVAAAHVAGALSLEDAVAIICRRSRLMRRLSGQGEMAVVELSHSDAEAALAGYEGRLSVAVSNSPRSTVIAGEPAALAEVLAALEAKKVFCRRVKVDVASHSPQVEPLRDDLLAALSALQPRQVAIPMRSTVTGARVAGPELLAGYWADNLRQPVRFATTVQALLEEGHGLFVEMSPHPVLVPVMEEMLQSAEKPGAAVGSLRRGQPERPAMLESLGALWVQGRALDWKKLFPETCQRVPLPTYPWQRERYWLEPRPGQARPAAVTAADWYYRIEWPEVARADASPTSDGHWLVLTDAGTDGTSVAAALRSRGQSCTVMQAPEGIEAVTEQANRAVEGHADLRGVVYLGGLDARVEDSASPGEIESVTQKAVAPVVGLLKAFASRPEQPRLWVVTRGGCAVGSETAVSPTQAALWGMGRVAALEHPNSWGGLIDLDPAGNPADVDSVVTELLAPDSEDQLAFRGGRRHAARLVRRPPEKEAAPVSLSAEGSYLVTGGLGAVGLLVARWLVERGARHLVLTSRNGLPERATWSEEQPADVRARITAIQALEEQGARVTVKAVDAADVDAMTALISEMDPALRGVVHAAGIGPAIPMLETGERELESVLRSKVTGGWLLHRLVREKSLDLFVLFSSGAAVWGGYGQGAYAAANAFVDGLAYHRRAQSLPAMSIAWGLWADGGMASAEFRERMDEIGVLPMSTANALTALEQLWATGAVQRTVTRMDWTRFAPVYAARGRRNLLNTLASAESGASTSASAAPAEKVERSFRGMSVAEARVALQELVRGSVAGVLGFTDPNELDVGRGFQAQGLDSLMAVQIRNRLQQSLGVSLSSTLAFDHPTVDRLVKHLVTDVLHLEDRVEVQTSRTVAHEEPIAIVGASCRLPGGAEDLESFWRLMTSGAIVTDEAPAERWKKEDWYDPDPEASGRTYMNKGGFLREVPGLDAAFFRISPREAIALDPQHRLLLEVSWEALEHAGLDPTKLRESQTGVFAGVGPNEYAWRLRDDSHGLYGATGNLGSVAAGRLSFFLGLHGPAFVVDTACSSSLVAFHTGCLSLRMGECEQALVAGVNGLFSPEAFVAASRMRVLAPDGKCKTFSAEADGFVRAEGCVVMVLKRLSDAQRDGDRILAVIRGTAINHDGPASGLTVPSGPAQQAVERTALAQAGVPPAEVDFVECHGTGTVLGDPIEVQALGAVYGQGRPSDRPLWLGAVKANVGHLEAAAGMTGLLKTVLALGHEQIPPQPAFGELNPHVPWEALPVAIPRQAVPWPKGGRPRRAGVSAFGLSGTNAHVIVEEAPAPQPVPSAPERSAELFVLSANSQGALEAQAARLAAHVEANPEQGLGDVAFNLATTRAAMEQRLAVVASSREGLREALESAAKGQMLAGAVQGRLPSGSVPKVVFVFPGQGSQWLGMGRKLLAEEPAFREALEACDKAIQAEAGWSLLKELAADEATSQLGRIDVVQPVLFAVEVALAALWRAWGVEPDAVVGHSMGEVAAAYVAGALSLEDAVAIICRRSVLLRRISGQGEMAVVELSRPEAEAALSGYEDRLSVAVSNSPRSTVIAGDPKALAEVLAALEAKQVFCRRVKVDVASHSPQVEPLREDLLAALSKLSPKKATVAMRSTVTGELVKGEELLANYWTDNLRQPVRFADAVQELLKGGHGLFIEMSPHPILTTSVEEMRRASERDGAVVGSLRRGQEERGALLEALGALWTQGYPVAWERQFPAGGRRVALPTYAWQRERYWIETPDEAPVRGGRRAHAGGHPLLGEGVAVSTQAGTRLWETTVEPKRLPWLGDHRVQGAVIFPGTGYLEMALSSGAEALGDGPIEVTHAVFAEALAFPGDAPVPVQVVTTEEQPGRLRFQVASQVPGSDAMSFRVHARAAVRRVQDAEAPETLDVEALRARLGASIPAATIYAALSEPGLGFGPAFQGLTELWPGEGEALGRVRLPEAAGSAAAYRIHPALLDACFQAMGGAVAATTEKTPWVLAEVGALRLWKRPSGELWSHARLSPGPQVPDRRSVDVRIVDGTGAVVAEITGLVVQRLAQTATRREDDDKYLELVWEPSAIPAAKAKAGRWLLLGSGGGLGVSLRGALEAAGHAVVHQTGDLKLAEAFDGKAPTAVVHLGSLDVGSGLDVGTVEAGLVRGYDSVLATVHALAAMGASNAPRLWLVTRGAQAVSAGEVSVTQSPLLGLARTIGAEHAELRCARVDLDPARPEEEVEGLVAELLGDDAEEEIAFRAGTRHVARIIHKPLEETAREQLAPAGNQPFRLENDAPGELDHLVLRATERRAPARGEVELAVEAAGLDAVDVRKETVARGGGFAGRVVAVGEGVEALAVGQEVVAVAPFSLGTHVTVDARRVAPRPATLSAAQAAAQTSAFLTAWYGLVHLGHLRAGERVLIHAASGGAALAAVQVARHLGAEVLATAATDAWRAWLREQGVMKVMDANAPDLAEQVLAATQGEGADIVLSGGATGASLPALAADGRFIALGATPSLSPALLEKGSTFSTVDLGGLAERRPSRFAALLKEVSELLAQGVLRPLPEESFPISRAADAFRKLEQGHLVEQVALTLDDASAQVLVPARPRVPIRADGSYLVTGGLGGLGLSLAGWLVEQGAGHLVLVGRSGAESPAQQAAVAALREKGARVTVARADVAERAQVERVLAEVAASGLPLRGIIHAAVVLDDGLLAQQTPARMRTVMAPKVLGSLHLHELTLGTPLDFFVMYASAAGFMGSPGQGNYAAANAFQDALAHHRRAKGLPALSIDWGAFSDVGQAAAQENRGARFASRGIRSMTPAEGLSALGRLIEADRTQTAVLPIDVPKWVEFYPALTSSRVLSRLLAARRAGASRRAGDPAVLQRLAAAEPEARVELLHDVLRAQVARVLRLPEARVDVDAPLRSLGMDSLMGLELRNRIEATLDVATPAALGWSYPTVRAITRWLLDEAGLVKVDANGEPEAKGKSFVHVIRPRPVVKPRARLFCFHGVGGSPEAFRAWAERPEWGDVEVVALWHDRSLASEEAPGRRYVQEAAALIQGLSDVPYALVGMSLGVRYVMGAAVELATRSGAPDPLALFMVGGSVALLQSADDTIVGELAAKLFMRNVAGYARPAEQIHSDGRADRSIADTMGLVPAGSAEPHSKVTAPIVAIASPDDSLVSLQHVQALEQHTSGRFRLHLLSGDHDFIVERNAEIMQLVDTHLHELLAMRMVPAGAEAAVSGLSHSHRMSQP
ncbi:SDR family NAD(P)-dependent oxidoreductase [Pyxidicoccus fallax]|uniref:SDR family NAD(P)-dependent oxidoreductase n=1 Tax=Pyxidicoccus fallax TaxID=394095 RepID=A0A848LDA9_9BACT|nr:type I polyketide synthase [Pyxidicoccus fallax]NMO16394.1 SDR family NAD(P)-dependent oxidoreductase [Pyxidicoccus fallax]NPC80375.1 SDR family NAD(P)-dependent oxidoreductase [Pyxidicoccus fallax]